MAEQAKVKGWNIDAVLNNEMVVHNQSNKTNIIDNTRVRVFIEALPAFEMDKAGNSIRSLGYENDGRSRQLACYIKEIGDRYVDQLQVVMIYRNDRFLRGGDHTPFVQKGFPAVRIIEMNENYNHQHQDVRVENGKQFGDLPEFCDFAFGARVARVNAAVLWSLAQGPGVLTQ